MATLRVDIDGVMRGDGMRGNAVRHGVGSIGYARDMFTRRDGCRVLATRAASSASKRRHARRAFIRHVATLCYAGSAFAFQHARSQRCRRTPCADAVRLCERAFASNIHTHIMRCHVVMAFAVC